jgi:hypothetical protein
MPTAKGIILVVANGNAGKCSIEKETQTQR